MLDPQIIAAMVSGIATLGGSIFEKWSGRTTRTDERLDEKLEDHYDTLRALLTDHCVLILRKLEDGQNRETGQIVPFVYPTLTFDNYEERVRFEKEFDYRLRFMAMIGVVTRPTSEYYITPLGMSFLRKAREKRDYYGVLFG